MSASIHRFDKKRFDKGDPPGVDSPGELDPRIRRILVDLPRERAGADFTAVVLERTGAARTRRRRLRSLAAAAAFCAFGALGAHEWNESQSRRATAERLAGLHLEYQMLQQELQELERAADEQRPVVYLGGEGDVEYVIDLSRLAPRRDTRPASNSSL